jgi:nicotinate-nucleotide adenylyltransferase
LTRLGLLGGTFNPPHYGHLVAAQEAAWRLRLTRVLWLPARQNPLKQGEPVTDADARCAMIQAAIGDDAQFELSRLDLDRPPPSYTVDLLRTLHAADRELFFVVGADIVPELPRWHAPETILQLATLVVVTRPGAPQADLDALEQQLPGARTRIEVLPTPGVDISSTVLRARVRAGQPIRYLTPPAVENYIRDNGLYRP